MASRNADSITNAQGEVHPNKPRDEPETTSGHKPGVLVGNDAVPEFHAQTLPAGSAPADRTFAPNTTSEVPGQALNDASLGSADKESTFTSAADTLGGSSSADVHAGMGKPVQGGDADVNSRGGGLAGVGAENVKAVNQFTDERMDPTQRGMERESGDLAGTKGGAEKGEAAEDRFPVSAEQL